MPLPVLDALRYPVGHRKRFFRALFPCALLLFLPGPNLMAVGYLTAWIHRILLEEEHEFPAWRAWEGHARRGLQVFGLVGALFLAPLLVLLLAGLPLGVGALKSAEWDQMLVQVLGGAFFGIFFLSVAAFLGAAAWFFFPMALIRLLEGGSWGDALSIRGGWEDIRGCLPDYLAAHLVVLLSLAGTGVLLWLSSALLLLVPFGARLIPFAAVLVSSLGMTYSAMVGGYLFAETYLAFLYSRSEVEVS